MQPSLQLKASKKHVVILSSVAASIALVIFSFFLITKSNQVEAISALDFKDGNIISDEVFYDKNSMSAAEIQAFLDKNIPNCDVWGTGRATEWGRSDLTRAQYAQMRGWGSPPFVCLNKYHENPTTKENSFTKGGGAFAGGISAAQIIYNAAQQYGISPKVLITLLKKESAGPLTNDSWPLQSQYKYAMGYACPDSGPGFSANCNDKQAGFYNQMTLAAWQLKYYKDNHNSYTYKLGWNNIQYNPDPACGTKRIFIENVATLSLYIYTPYVPNQVALQNYPGTSHCGAYGNRNFFMFYNEMFGSTWEKPRTLISYQSKSINNDWQKSKINDDIMGVTGQSKAIEAVKFDGEVTYSTFTTGRGWSPFVSGSMQSGVIDQNSPIQAIKVSPTGKLATEYDIWYRAHVSNIGWMDWTNNGNVAGSAGNAGQNIEAIEFSIKRKDSPVTFPTQNPSNSTSNQVAVSDLGLSVKSHVSDIGWQTPVQSDTLSGTVGLKKSIEALNISLGSAFANQGDIVYSSHLTNIGWQEVKKNGEISGTTGRALTMQAIRIKLTGALEQNYNVWYRTNVVGIGMLGWAKNGEPSGSVGVNLPIDGIEIRIEPKNIQVSSTATTVFHNPTKQPLPSSAPVLKTTTHVSNIGWMNPVSTNLIAGTTGRNLPLEALKFNIEQNPLNSYQNINIVCSSSNDGQNWTTNAGRIDNLCGTTGQAKPLRAIRLQLTGSDALKYDLTYSIHASNIGWMPYVGNGIEASSPAKNMNIEAIKVNLTAK